MSAAAITIRAARVSDAAAIVGVIRAGFEPERLALTVYGCSGIVEYIADQVAALNRDIDTRFWVADTGEHIVGCLELRNRPGLAWINYVAVLPEFRHHHLGTRLLDEGTAPGTWGDQPHVGLDVFDDNAGAIRWYERLGFVAEDTRVLAEVGVPATEAAPYFVSSWPQASLAHQRYGFSELRVVTERGTHTVGLLGDQWFRIGDVSAVLDPGMAAALRSLDPQRRVLVAGFAQGSSAAVTDFRVLARSRRMRVPIATLRRGLAGA